MSEHNFYEFLKADSIRRNADNETKTTKNERIEIFFSARVAKKKCITRLTTETFLEYDFRPRISYHGCRKRIGKMHMKMPPSAQKAIHVWDTLYLMILKSPLVASTLHAFHFLPLSRFYCITPRIFTITFLLTNLWCTKVAHREIRLLSLQYPPHFANR